MKAHLCHQHGQDSGSLSGSAIQQASRRRCCVSLGKRPHVHILHRALIGWHELEASKSWPDLRGTALLPPIEGCFSSQELWKVRTRPKLESTSAENDGADHDVSGASMAAAVGAECKSGHSPPTAKPTPKNKGKGKAKQKSADKPPVKKPKGSAAAKKKADVAQARVKWQKQLRCSCIGHKCCRRSRYGARKTRVQERKPVLGTFRKIMRLQSRSLLVLGATSALC